MNTVNNTDKTTAAANNTANSDSRKRSYYISAQQASDLFQIFTECVKKILPEYDLGTKKFFVELQDNRADVDGIDNRIDYFLNGSIKVHGRVPEKPDCDFVVFGPWSGYSYYIPGPKHRTIADRFGMAILHEIAYLYPHVERVMADITARMDNNQHLTEKEVVSYNAVTKLIRDLDKFQEDNTMRVHPLALVAERNLAVEL